MKKHSRLQMAAPYAPRHAPPSMHDDLDAEDLLNEQHGGDHDTGWLISYADMVTLLLGFFVMMFIFSSMDERTYAKRMSKALETSFGEAPSIKLLNALQAMGPSPGMKIKPVERGIQATFVSAALFESGSANLVADAYKPLTRMVSEIKKIGIPPIIRVEGHTDDIPIHTNVFRSNWDLSSARAVTLVHFFESQGFPGGRLEAVGLGASQPEQPNRDAQGGAISSNQMQNRRVVIKVLVDE